jgi:formylglycine-generating enzyme required for sulfatase activity
MRCAIFRRPVLLAAVLTLAAAAAVAAWAVARGKAGPAPLALGSETACGGYRGLPPGWRQDPHAGMVRLSAGSFAFGSVRGYPDERPLDAGKTRVAAFWIDQTEVTNAQFGAFVQATGYVTDAERQGGAVLFAVPSDEELQRRPLAWWRFVDGANWRRPGGPGSAAAPANLPVTLVTQADALAYARWLGRDLPTEAEWEYAGKAGRTDAQLDEAPRGADGKPAANYWQGMFPSVDTGADGHAGLAPVGCYAANGFQLYDMIGNAWEWTLDPYTGQRQPHNNGGADTALPAAVRAASRPDRQVVIKGGSFLCSPDYCVRYRAAAREAQEADLGAAHIGFRTVLRDG